MAYGMECWDAGGTKVLSVTDRLTRLRYEINVSANSNGSVNLPDISGKESVQFAVALENGMQHSVSRSGTTISWVAQDDMAGLTGSADSKVLVFLYT